MSFDASRTRGRTSMVLAVALVLAYEGFGYAQASPPFDVAALVKETHRQSARRDRPMFVQWIPVEIWTEDVSIRPEYRTQIEQVLAPYVLVVIAQPSTPGASGEVAYSERDLRESARLIDAQGNLYAALSNDRLSDEAKSIVDAVRPALSRMFGLADTSVNLLPFPNELSGDRRIFPRARDAGFFSLRVAEEEFTWRLPLRALVPPTR